ncbi:hypothetical protein ACHAW5_006523 [Stephanodiscus triporus]|uniref:Ricin B lectin domain-containing protein n=1 Tax=Stephanodiscus triporus TaxID=2934178 RepID=A0ABD3N966_9STRA
MMAAFALSQVTRESGGRQAVVAASLEDETTKAVYIKNETTISLENETTTSISLEDETTKAVSLEDETTEFLPPQIDEPSPRLPEELLPTKEPSQPDAGPFRLRLYWEKGYRWQNNREEKWYCTECDDCNQGDSIYMEWCGSTKRQQFLRVGKTIRLARNESLCWTVTGHSESKPIRLFDCEEYNADQIFEGFKNEDRFELHPKEDSSRCVSILHHVKSYERIYPEKCNLAQDDNSSYWITF